MISTVFALEFESTAFRTMLTKRLCVSVWTLGLAGYRGAPVLRRLIEKSRPEIIVSAGFSGALQPDIGLGAIVIGDNFSDPQLLQETLSKSPTFRKGSITTVESVLETAIAKKALGESSGALACDMESSHLYAICVSAGIPMLSVRCISDVFDQDMPLPGNILIDPETGKSDPAAIFRHLFRHPGQAPQFAKLINEAKIAQKSLAKALVEILPILLKQRRSS